MNSSIGIIGTGSYVPDTVLANAKLAKVMNVSESWILDKTGIKERRVAAPHEAASDLATLAAQNALHSAGIGVSEIDLIIVATATGDQPAPATACFVQANIGAEAATCFDIAAACSGFLYALRLGHDMLAASSDKYALVIGTDVYSRFSRYEDTKTRVLIGDGAGAAILGSVPDGGIIAGELGTDGRLNDVGGILGGGSRHPASEATISAGWHYLQMDGKRIRSLAGPALANLTERVLYAAGIDHSDIDVIVPHQANGVMLQEWCDLLHVDPAKVHKTIDKYGNTGAASVPLTLDDCVKSARLGHGDIALLLAIGGGVTWGATVIQWNK